MKRLWYGIRPFILVPLAVAVCALGYLVLLLHWPETTWLVTRIVICVVVFLSAISAFLVPGIKNRMAKYDDLAREKESAKMRRQLDAERKGVTRGE